MIKFECSGCHRKLSVDDTLAGKKGKCPGCKKAIVVPASPARSPAPVATPTPTPTPQLPTPPSLDGPARTQEELDREAMEALADEPPAEDAVPEEFTFDCPMCGEKITMKTELAGKRAPCPNRECGRIIKVPEPEKKQKPKDWRQMDRRPGGSRLPDEPAPEGAWGTEDKRTIGSETAEEFGLSRKREKPVPWLDRVFPYFYYAVMLAVASMLGLGLWARAYSGYEKGLLATATAYVGDNKANAALGREGIAAVHRGVGEYHFRRKESTSAARGREQCDAALAALGSPTRDNSTNERDAVLVDVGMTLLDFSADKKDPAVERGEKLDWDATQKGLAAAVRAMGTAEGRREGVRLLARRLIASGHPERALPLAGQVSATAREQRGVREMLRSQATARSGPGVSSKDSTEPDESKVVALATAAARAEAEAIVGLELYSAGKKDLAAQAVELALRPYASKEDAPALSAPVVALATLLNQKLPAAKESSETENEYVGQTEALAREGKLDEARKRVSEGQAGRRFRCAVAIASVTADTEATDVESAIQTLTGPLRGNQNTSPWLVYRLVLLGLQAKVPADKLADVAAEATDSTLRSRGALLLLGRELASAKDVKPCSGPEVEKLGNGLERYLAVEILCRHNASVNSSWGNDIQEWKDAQKAFGALGVLQGRYRR
jgi:hypothetical protein